jgi:hypothetical protein
VFIRFSFVFFYQRRQNLFVTYDTVRKLGNENVLCQTSAFLHSWPKLRFFPVWGSLSLSKLSPEAKRTYFSPEAKRNAMSAVGARLRAAFVAYAKNAATYHKAVADALAETCVLLRPRSPTRTSRAQMRARDGAVQGPQQLV